MLLGSLRQVLVHLWFDEGQLTVKSSLNCMGLVIHALLSMLAPKSHLLLGLHFLSFDIFIKNVLIIPSSCGLVVIPASWVLSFGGSTLMFIGGIP